MACHIEIGGKLPAALIPALADQIEASGASDEWLPKIPDDCSEMISDGEILDLYHNDHDELAELEEFCVAHDLTFRRWTTDHEPVVEVYEPGMGNPDWYFSTADGDPLVRLDDKLPAIRRVELLASLVVPPLCIVNDNYEESRR
jgi:hypothetical protein